MLSSVKAHEHDAHDAHGLLSILSSLGAAGKTLLNACSKTWHLGQPVVGCAEAERLCRCITMLRLIVAIHAVQFVQ